ncbi:MAG: phosphatase PAP2 family protein [Proteobacteria bacterium]|nr:phosphatase PAP2 family protein [Pseudomonadota bacterium]
MPIRTLLFALLLLIPSVGWAADKPYLTHAELNLVDFLPKSVVNGSPEDRAEQAVVIAAQKAATPERIALAYADGEETVFAMFGTLMGPKFKADALPRAREFFARIGETEDAVVDPVKAVFGRKRPFLNNPEIKALVKPSSSNSYPSGHTTRSTMMAIILATIVPEKHDAIFERTKEYSESRIIGGMHYPNDLEGGRRAGTAIAATMLADAAFRKDMEAAKAEIRAVLGM